MAYYWEQLMTIVSVPLYAICIFSEILLSKIYHQNHYHPIDTLNNFLMTAFNLTVEILMRSVFILFIAWGAQFSVISWTEKSFIYWTFIIVLEDLAYWFLHWVGHHVRLFWAVHVVHHSSENFNITVGFRSSVFEPLYRSFFFLPLAFLGFDAADIMLAFAIQQLYGSLIHTNFIKKLGVLEHILVTPSHHRVHHASNPKYLDKNMGMLFIFWDKIFRTFEAEDPHYQPIKYGLTHNIQSYHPLHVLTHEFKQMFTDVKNAPSLKYALMYIFGPPGWSHDGSRLTSNQLREIESISNSSENGRQP